MSRYIDKPHGLRLGSSNVFFVIDRAHPTMPDKIRDGYNAIVSFKGYTFDSLSSANYYILTPAQQLVWRKNVCREMQTMGEHTYQIDKQFWTISNWIVRWLDENVGALHDKWDCYTESEISGRCIFFKRRKDALAFCKFIDTTLSGVKIGDW